MCTDVQVVSVPVFGGTWDLVPPSPASGHARTSHRQLRKLEACSWVANSHALASYPVLLAQAFVAGSTNAGERPGKLITCSGVPGCWVDVWRSGTFPEKLWVHYWLQPKTTQWLSSQCQAVLGDVSWVHESRLTAIQEEYATPPHVHPRRMSGYFTQVIVDVAGMLATPIRLQDLW